MITGTKVLVTGGVRSGKSRHAEQLLAANTEVTYLAPGPIPDPQTDPEWAERIAAHVRRRPAHWHTTETADLTGALHTVGGDVIIDCLGTWITRVFDDRQAWELPTRDWQAILDVEIAALAAAVHDHAGAIVVVTNEVGLGVVPEHRSGRLFRDALGLANQAVARVCDRVDLVIAGRVLSL